MGNFNSTKMNWIFFGCLVVVGLPALALASGCDKKEAPLCVSADVPKTPEAKPKPYDCNKCYIDAVARQFAEVDIWIPKCDPKGDWFVKEQYNKVKNEAFCITKYGDEFAGSRIKGNKVDCSKFPDAKVSPRATIKKCLLERSKAKKNQERSISLNATKMVTICLSNAANKAGVGAPNTMAILFLPLSSTKTGPRHSNKTAISTEPYNTTASKMDQWSIPLIAIDTSFARHPKCTTASAPRVKCGTQNYVFAIGKN